MSERATYVIRDGGLKEMSDSLLAFHQTIPCSALPRYE